MLIAQSAVDAAKVGVTIAIRYSAQRPQFGGKLILEYLTHQRRLFPALATTYAMHIAMTRLKVLPPGRPCPAPHRTAPHVSRTGHAITRRNGQSWYPIDVGPGSHTDQFLIGASLC